VNPVRVLDWFLALACKDRKDRARSGSSLLSLESFIDGILTEAVDGVMLQVSGRQSVLRILIASNPTKVALAFARRTREKVAQTPIGVLDFDIGLEKSIDHGSLASLLFICKDP
jgi:hypothetical protein